MELGDHPHGVDQIKEEQDIIAPLGDLKATDGQAHIGNS